MYDYEPTTETPDWTCPSTEHQPEPTTRWEEDEDDGSGDCICPNGPYGDWSNVDCPHCGG